MAVVFSDGFETNDFSAWSTSSGTIATSTAQVNEGTYSARINLAVSGTGFVRKDIYGVDQTGSLYARAYIYIATAPSATIQVLRFSSTANAHVGSLRLTSSRTLTLNAASNATIGSASAALSLNTWYYIELKITAPSNPGTLEGKLNGTSFASGNNSAQGSFARLLTGNVTPNATGDIYIDSVVANDSAYPGAIVPPPTAPTNLAGVQNGSNIDLTWTDNSSDETGFVLERKRGSSNYYQIATPAANATSYTDTDANLFPGYTYTYRIKAVKTGAESTYNTSSGVTMSGSKTWHAKPRAWLYPGSPAENANEEYSDGRALWAIKPEYYQVNASGVLDLLSDPANGENAYNAYNVRDVKNRSHEQFITVASNNANMSVLLNNGTLNSNARTTLVNAAVDTGFTGIELDWEGFADWTSGDYTLYKTFVTDLGTSLHAVGKKLSICGPPITNLTEQGFYEWKYEDFNSITQVDIVTMMLYDYQYDYGAGESVQPKTWASAGCYWIRSKITDINRISIGIPAYGYHGTTGGFTITVDTKAQSAGYTGYGTATRNGDGEMTWVNAGTSYVYQDTTGLNTKREYIEDEGILNISVWHLGGNDWFTGTEPIDAVRYNQKFFL